MRISLLLIFSLIYTLNLDAKGTAAGTVIRNVATLDFVLDERKEQVKSNVVHDTVAQLIDLDLVAQESKSVRFSDPNNIPVLAFGLTNTGNGADSFLLRYDISDESGFKPAHIKIALDTNRNHRFDPEDQTTDRVSLPADASETIFLVADLSAPPEVKRKAAKSVVSLIASSQTGGSGIRGKIHHGKGVKGTDAVDGDKGGVEKATSIWEYIAKQLVSMVQHTAITDPYGTHEPIRGAVITYDIAIRSLVDKNIDKIHFTNPVPEHTTYQKGTIRYQNRALSDEADGDNGAYDSKNNLIIVDIDRICPKQTVHISFQVKID